MGFGKDVYAKTAVGTVETVRTVVSGATNAAVGEYEQFQLVLKELEGLERAGLIVITLKHNESTTGRRFVDMIQFRRLQ